ncbi:MAG: hypothetical protein AAGA93_09370 [Actinomycetota bacterium]
MRAEGSTTAAVDPVGWLEEKAEPGDLLLTGSSGRLSRAVQWGTRSGVSHTAIVRGDGKVIEAWDHAFTPNEDDDGVFERTKAEFASRTDLQRLIVRRPREWPEGAQARLDRSLDFAVRHSPPFPTVGAGLTCTLVALSHPRTRRATERFGPLLTRPLDGVLDWLAETVGDGPDTVHCSEIATRLYTHVGLELRFVEPTLGPLLYRVLGGKETDDGLLKVRMDERPAVSVLHRRPRRARPSEPVEVDKRAGSKEITRANWQRTGSVLIASAAQAGRRAANGRTPTRWRLAPDGRAVGPATTGESLGRAVDLADLILPADFERSPTFVTEGMIVNSDGRWREAVHRPFG